MRFFWTYLFPQRAPARVLPALLALGLVTGCAQNSTWDAPSSWFGKDTVAQQGKAAQTNKKANKAQTLQPTTEQGQAGAETPPQAAPVAAVTAGTPSIDQPGVIGHGTRVALLLPLSGPNAALGQAMQNAAQLALFDLGDNSFQLMPRDTGNTEDGALKAAQDAVANGAQLIIGPLFASQIQVVRQTALSANISVMPLSTDTSLASANTYVMGFAPEQQVTRIITFAAQHGGRQYAALVPNTPYGHLVAAAFQQAVVQNGGTVAGLESYDPSTDAGLPQALQNLSMHNATIDTLFLPESGNELARLSGPLTTAGFDPQRVHRIGTGLWDVVGLAQQVPFLQGAWYAASEPATRGRFITGYSTTYGQEPPRLASLAYDATALAAVLSRRNNGFTTASLTNPNGFAGLDGIFRLNPDGHVERGLAILQVTTASPQVIESAPTSFVKP
ncbi:MAG: penicillin-binding protein activator [Alphaproteobacteria bacterium]|nr:penicillin-binding protein activator [Alphaproteobacteria bacterium]